MEKIKNDTIMRNTMKNRPRYNKLYADLIREKCPEKMSLCNDYFQKENWTSLDVMYVNDLLFGHEKKKSEMAIDQKHRAYDVESIKDILKDQLRNKLNNIQVATKYKLSRNTVAKWKKLFSEEVS